MIKDYEYSVSVTIQYTAVDVSLSYNSSQFHEGGILSGGRAQSCTRQVIDVLVVDTEIGDKNKRFQPSLPTLRATC